MAEEQIQFFGRFAPGLQRLGYSVVPILPGQKRPAIDGWQSAWRRPVDVTGLGPRMASCSVGVLCRGLAVIDIDVYDKRLAKRLRDYVVSLIGATPPTRVGQRPKLALFCRRAEGPMPKMSSSAWRDEDGRANRVEVLGDGQQIVVYGLHAGTQQPYLWVNRDLVQSEVAVADLPEVSTAQLEQIIAYADELFEQAGMELISGTRSGASAGEVPLPVAGLTLELAREALEHYPNDDLHYDDWLTTGMALHQQFNGYVEAFELWDEWSAQSSKNRGTAVNWKHWQSFDEEKPGGITMRTILRYAEGNGWRRPSYVEGAPVDDDWPEPEPVASGDPVDELPALPPSDTPEAEPPTPAGAVEPQKAPTVRLKGGGTLELLPSTTPEDWGDYRPGPREWLWDQLIPIGEVTALYAHGGTGKTALAQTLASLVALGEPCLGNETMKGKALLVLCEDAPDDAIRRQDRINDVLNIDREALGDQVRFVCRKGRDNVLMHFPKAGGKGVRTPFWRQLAATVAYYRPRLVVIDTAADVFAGNENVRTEVRQFLQEALISIASRYQCAVLLLAHTSRTGATEGVSGSTAWHNTVRSRLFLRRDEQRDGVLILSHGKSNYGPEQADKLLRLVDGVPVLMAGELAEATDAEVQCREHFLEMLRVFESQGRQVSDASRGGRYAPQVFAKEQRIVLGPHVNWRVQDYETAMAWLLREGVVELRESRGKRARHLAIADPGAALFGDEHSNNVEEWLL